MRLTRPLALLMLLAPATALAHGAAEWIQSNPATSYCCGPDDCAPLAEGDVVITPESYLIRSRGEIVPYDKALPSINHQYWMCIGLHYQEDPKPIVCFFAPAVGS